jgi:chromosome partitioning protein
MRIISIMNQKGGCGKTTTAINLSAFLADSNKKVLLVDLDPQGHSTEAFNFKENRVELELYDVFTKLVKLDAVIKPQVYPRLDLAPTTIRLSAIEQYLSGTIGREVQLRHHINSLDSTYDYIIIDSPPQLGLLAINALFTSTDVIVPIETSSFSLQGVDRFLSTLEMVKENNPGQSIRVMALQTIYHHHYRISREVLSQIQNKFQEGTLKTIIRQNVKLREAVQKGCPISLYDPHSLGAVDYKNLAEEIILQENPPKVWTHNIYNTNTRFASVIAEPAKKTQNFW